MHLSKSDSPASWMKMLSRRESYIAINAVGVIGMAGAAMLVTRELRHVYPPGLAWLPAVAFLGAALSRCGRFAPWATFIALGLNTASLLLFILTLHVSLTDANVGALGLAYALLGGALAGWNLMHLSRELWPE